MSPYAIRGGSTVQPSWHSNLHFWPQTHDLWHIIRILVGFTVSGISHFSTMCFHRFSVGFPPFPVKYGDIPFIPQKISMFDANKISNKSPCCWNSQWNPMEITTFNASISSKKPAKNQQKTMKKPWNLHENQQKQQKTSILAGDLSISQRTGPLPRAPDAKAGAVAPSGGICGSSVRRSSPRSGRTSTRRSWEKRWFP